MLEKLDDFLVSTNSNLLHLLFHTDQTLTDTLSLSDALSMFLWLLRLWHGIICGNIIIDLDTYKSSVFGANLRALCNF